MELGMIGLGRMGSNYFCVTITTTILIPLKCKHGSWRSVRLTAPSYTVANCSVIARWAERLTQAREHLHTHSVLSV